MNEDDLRWLLENDLAYMTGAKVHLHKCPVIDMLPEYVDKITKLRQSNSAVVLECRAAVFTWDIVGHIIERDA